MPSDDTAPQTPAAPTRPRSSRSARATALASLVAAAALGALASAGGCIPAPFTFEEEEGAGGSPSASGGGQGGESPATSGSGAGGASSSSSTGTGMIPCGVGQMCIEEVPAGWEAHALLMVAPMGGKPECPTVGETPEKLNKDPTGPHACTPCNCSIANAVCSAPEITCWYQDAGCAGSGPPPWKATSSACITDQTGPVIEDLEGSCKLTAPAAVLSGGQCSASTSQIVNSDIWSTDVRSCAPVNAGSCGGGAVCVPNPAPGEQICIRKDGIEKCPDGWEYNVVAYKDAVDTRSCTGCGCVPIACSGGGYVVYDGIACDALTNNVLVDSMNCTSVPGILDGASVSLAPMLAQPTQQGCFGGKPEGSIEPIDPVTFCCKNP